MVCFLSHDDGLAFLLAERELGAEAALACPIENPFADACVENAHARGFVHDDLVSAASARLPARDHVAELGLDVPRPEAAARDERVEGLARRRIAKHLIGSRQKDTRAQHGFLVALARRERERARAAPAETAPPADDLPPPVDLDKADRDLDLFGRVQDEEGRPVAGARLATVS